MAAPTLKFSIDSPTITKLEALAASRLKEEKMFTHDQLHIPREIVLKVRLSQTESDALARLTAIKDMGASAVVRQLIVRAANTK